MLPSLSPTRILLYLAMDADRMVTMALADDTVILQHELCQKRPKETYYRRKRDLLKKQTRPTRTRRSVLLDGKKPLCQRRYEYLAHRLFFLKKKDAGTEVRVPGTLAFFKKKHLAQRYEYLAHRVFAVAESPHIEGKRPTTHAKRPTKEANETYYN